MTDAREQLAFEVSILITTSRRPLPATRGRDVEAAPLCLECVTEHIFETLTT